MVSFYGLVQDPRLYTAKRMFHCRKLSSSDYGRLRVQITPARVSPGHAHVPSGYWQMYGPLADCPSSAPSHLVYRLRRPLKSTALSIRNLSVCALSRPNPPLHATGKSTRYRTVFVPADVYIFLPSFERQEVGT